MRREFLALALLLLLALGWLAWSDPALPFLPPAAGRTWWVHPRPLWQHGGGGAQRLEFRLTVAQTARLDILAMSRFRLLGARGPIAASTDAARWKQPQTVELEPGEYRLELEDPRLRPALGLGGPGAPSRVEVRDAGQWIEALPAPALSAVRPALGAASRAVRLLAVLLAAIALGGMLLRRPRGEPRPDRPRPGVLAAIVVLHGAIALWNAARFPIERGLDAAGHRAYAGWIAANGALPDPGLGFQTYHPPLYHAAGALLLRLTGSERSLQWLNAAAGIGLVVLLARALGPARWRAVLWIAALPVLLVTEPQATNELLLAALGTALLARTPGALDSPRRALGCGLLAGLALLTRYTAVVLLAAFVLALLPSARQRRTRSALAVFLLAALAIGAWPYLERLQRFGDPFVGNWDDALGQPYRQPPGVRTAGWFLGFGHALVAHPFEAVKASFADALWSSSFADAFGRFPDSPARHAAGLALEWLALPLVLTASLGFLAIALGGSAQALERAAVLAIALSLAALLRFNLELPYYSAAKGVFLLALSLPLGLCFERGRREVERRVGPGPLRPLDAALGLFALLAAAVFTWPA